MSLGINTRITNTREQPSTFNRGKTLYVGGIGPDNYTKIQDAIENASHGDIVYVYNGIYPHNVWIDKSISLVGEDKNNTIIEGGWGTVVIIDMDEVLVTGFTIRDCGYYYIGGIHICSGANNVTIVNNILTNNLQCGISIRGNYNKIENNTIKENYQGIKLAGDYNKIVGNIIDSNNYSGIYFVWLRNKKSYYPIYSYNVVKNNVITYNDVGIYLENCNNTLLINNLIAYNKFSGVFADFNEEVTYKNNTKIENNTILYNKYGMYLIDSNKTTISDNIIALNKWSIFINDCNKNLVYHNNIISNENPPYDENYFCENCINQWDNGYPSGGNFWSDYIGSDDYSGTNQTIPGSDGIGDIPYNISGNTNSQDRYPLMEPWDNIQPDAPTINGPTSGKAGEYYNYTFMSTDPDGDYVWYHICWGDKEIIYIYGPYHSGVEIKLSYTWSEKGTFTITCWARDVCSEESVSTELEVTMPRNRATYNSLFLRFLEQFPILQKILCYIL